MTLNDVLEKQAVKLSSKQKKIILLLVEGESEQILLYDRLRRKFHQQDIRFHIERGDLFGNLRHQKRDIKAAVNEVVRQFLHRYRLKESDLLAVIHIMDTDGCFIDEQQVMVAPPQGQGRKTFYADRHILVLDEMQRKSIVKRNEQKNINAKIMVATSYVMRSHIPYQLYFFSRALEHVLFDKPNPRNENKLHKVEQFVDQLREPLEVFLAQFLKLRDRANMDQIYEESWHYIMQGNHSLQRATNVALLFEFIASIQRNDW